MLPTCTIWWNWVDAQGYGIRPRAGFAAVRVDRIAYERVYGPMPDSAELYHVCGELRCFNPDHMLVKDSNHAASTRTGPAINC